MSSTRGAGYTTIVKENALLEKYYKVRVKCRYLTTITTFCIVVGLNACTR